jgi:tRNA(adenine34) deaminase
MREALRQARRAAAQDEVPIGAIIVHDRQIIARSWNQVETLKDATAHAEMLALTQAQSVFGDWRLTDCDLYVTKEPCPMCAGAIVHTRIRRVIFGCPDVKGGAAGGFWNLLQTDNLNHRCEVSSGILGDDCVAILKDFFAQARRRKADGTHHQKGLGITPPVFDGP